MNFINNFFIFLMLIVSISILSCSSDAPTSKTSQSSATKTTEKKTAEKELVQEATATLATANSDEEVKAEEAIIEIHLTDDGEEYIEPSGTEKVINKKKDYQKEAPKESASKRTKKSTKAAATPSKSGAKIKFENPIYEFGNIKQGDEFQHRFKFENTGKEDLIISNVKASCGCTQPSYPFLPIKPGETGHIDVTYNSTGKMLKQKPVITVTSNATPRSNKLYLSGYVEVEMAKKTTDVITPDTTAGSH